MTQQDAFEDKIETSGDWDVALCPMVFVVSCLVLLSSQLFSSTGLLGLDNTANKILSFSWVFWLGIAASLIIMIFFRRPSVRSILSSFALSVVCGIFTLGFLLTGFSWDEFIVTVFVMMLLFAPVWFALGQYIFKRLIIKIESAKKGAGC